MDEFSQDVLAEAKGFEERALMEQELKIDLALARQEPGVSIRDFARMLIDVWPQSDVDSLVRELMNAKAL